VIILFLALYPNFVVIGSGGVMAQVLMLSAVLILINVIWQVGLVGFANIARGRLVRTAVQRTVGRISGAILIGFGAAMIWEHLT
jgi:threonine/homoserine/homoserine lactone efflux protein